MSQIPSKYKFTYTIKGTKVVDKFEIVDPDKANEKLNNTKPQVTNKPSSVNDIKKVNTNGNGVVTIAEAKAAGYKCPLKEATGSIRI